MGHKMVIHAGNFKKGSVGALQHHNLRENDAYSNADIDRERSKDNFIIKQPDISQYQDTKNIIEQRAVNQIRSTSVWQSEFIISSDKEFFNDLPLSEQNRFFLESYDYLCQVFGEENVTCSAVHYDEKTPHMHFDFVPMTEANKLSRKEVMTRERLLKIQDDMPRHLREKGFDVERGRKMADLELKDRPKHLEPQEYKKALQEQIRALEGQKKSLDNGLKSETQKAAEIERLQQENSKREKKVLETNAALKEITAMNQRQAQELRERQKVLSNACQEASKDNRLIDEIPKGKKNLAGNYVYTPEENKVIHNQIKKYFQEKNNLRDSKVSLDKTKRQYENLTTEKKGLLQEAGELKKRVKELISENRSLKLELQDAKGIIGKQAELIEQHKEFLKKTKISGIDLMGEWKKFIKGIEDKAKKIIREMER